jgi:hypothetical protein
MLIRLERQAVEAVLVRVIPRRGTGVFLKLLQYAVAIIHEREDLPSLKSRLAGIALTVPVHVVVLLSGN